MILGLKLITNLANGLRKNFYNEAKNIFQKILFQFLNKKQFFVPEVHKALNSLLLCISF